MRVGPGRQIRTLTFVGMSCWKAGRNECELQNLTFRYGRKGTAAPHRGRCEALPVDRVVRGEEMADDA